jgi:hypothetical protein
MAMAAGSLATAIVGSGALVAVSIGVTVFESWFTTYASLLFGVIAMAVATDPTLIAGAAALVAVKIGVTMLGGDCSRETT